MTMLVDGKIQYVNKDGLIIPVGSMSIFDINRVLKKLFELEEAN